MEKQIIIMRGLSGSGKSTYHKKYYPEAVVCSADEFFITPTDGEYKHDPAMIGQAHQQCFAKFLNAVAEGQPVIVVDNTNIQRWEVSPYYMTGMVFGYQVLIVTIDCTPQTATQRGIHGTPIERNQQYYQNFESSLPFWRELKITTEPKSTT
ncbi:MAG: AAA family ATPase [Candidatus Parcubacteria bacterium]|nr:AAA family ATPase [Candidatus Parcubacteria bacterium]